MNMNMNLDMKSLKLALISALLFFVLSPGVLLTIPPKCNGLNGMFFQAWKEENNDCSSSVQVALFHSVVFFVVAYCMLSKIM
jgi:hypothetical protein